MGWFGDNSSTEHIRSGESHVLTGCGSQFHLPSSVWWPLRRHHYQKLVRSFEFTSPTSAQRFCTQESIFWLHQSCQRWLQIHKNVWRCQRFVNSSETWAQPFSCHWRCQPLGLSLVSLIRVLRIHQHQQLVGSSGLLSWVLSRQPACWLLSPELVSEWSQRTLTVQFQCANQWRPWRVTTHGSSSFSSTLSTGVDLPFVQVHCLTTSSTFCTTKRWEVWFWPERLSHWPQQQWCHSLPAVWVSETQCC